MFQLITNKPFQYTGFNKERRCWSVLLFGFDVSPVLNIGVTKAAFHTSGTLPESNYKYTLKAQQLSQQQPRKMSGSNCLAQRHREIVVLQLKLYTVINTTGQLFSRTLCEDNNTLWFSWLRIL